jgi:uncharacterized protein
VTFPCTRCGACCRMVGTVEGLRDLDRGDGACVHLQGEPGEEHGCAIYETRPALCRVDGLRPEVVSIPWWYGANGHACDQLHLAVYGQERARG